MNNEGTFDPEVQGKPYKDEMLDQAMRNELLKMQPFAAEVWRTLSRVDVGDYIETKGDKFKLSYLSWTFAWAQLMKHYPESEFSFLDDSNHPDGSVTVHSWVIVRDGARALQRQMWLPVMDHTNKSIPNPSSRQVSDSKMRCLVKCLALFGLGLDVYAGSDAPIGTLEDHIDEGQVELINSLLEKSGADVERFFEWMKVDAVASIPAIKFKQAELMLANKIRSQAK